MIKDYGWMAGLRSLVITYVHATIYEMMMIVEFLLVLRRDKHFGGAFV